MATLPDISTQERPVPQASGAVAGYQPQGNNAGEAISRGGRDFEEVAGIVAQMNERQDAMSAQSAANSLEMQSTNLQRDPTVGFMSVRGGAAANPDFVKTFQEKFDTAKAEIRNGLTSENQKRIFDAHAGVAAWHFQSRLLRHQALETDQFNNETENATIDIARKQIFETPDDPQALQAGFAQINAAIDQKGTRLNLPQEQISKLKADYAEKVYEDVVGLGIEKDPNGYLQAMNKRMGIGQEAGPSGNAAVDSLDPKKLIQYHNRASSYVQQAQNKSAANDEKILRIGEDAVKGAGDLAVTGVPFSPEYSRQLRALTAGTPYAAQAEALIGASLMGATFGTKTLPQQEQTLRQMDAEVSKTGTDPTSAKMLARIREIHGNQVAAYKENPYAAATRFARQPEVPEESTADLPALIQKRLPAMTGVEVAAGQPISPLQPNEATAFTARLESLQPDAAAKELGQAGTLLSLPRLEALADQIDKKNKPMALALKLGTDGTTAGRPVGELVLRGAQALKDKTVKRDDAVLTGWRTEIAGLVRGTLGDAKAEEDAIDAAYYIRAAMDADASKAPGYKFDTSAESAVRFAVGAPLERNGVKTILPREMDEDIFDAKLKTFTPDVLRTIAPSGTVYVRGQPQSLEKFSASLDRLGMRRAGGGNYVPSSGGAFVTLDPQGQVPLRLPIK